MSQVIIRNEIAPAWLRILKRDRDGFEAREHSGDCPTLECVATIDRLTNAIEAGEPIDLAAPRSPAEAEYDRGESPTVGGYLLGLIRYGFGNGTGDRRNSERENWLEFIALGSLGVDIEAIGGVA